METDYSFVENHIAIENIGTHDFDNSWLGEDFPKQISAWKKINPDCTIIGICYDDKVAMYNKQYRPLVYEDENGDRFYTHWNVEMYKEYRECGLL